MLLLASLLATASPGYGVPVDGHPTWEARAVHYWTNAARIAPSAFTTDYARGDCRLQDFGPLPSDGLPTLAWSRDLAAAARFHNDDMVDNRFLGHTSSDGTSFGDRVGGFYSGGMIGENVAAGYATPRDVVLAGWMCSDGHRANILTEDFLAIGTAGEQRVWTQVFGRSGEARQPIAQAIHHPLRPSGTVTFRADGTGDALLLDVILDGEVLPMIDEAGDGEARLYAVDAAIEPGCHTWYVRGTWEDGTETLFPAEGAFAFGDCALDDPSGWVAERTEPLPEEDPDDDDPDPTPDDGGGGPASEGDGTADPDDAEATGGCSTAPASPTLLLLLVPLLARRRR